TDLRTLVRASDECETRNGQGLPASSGNNCTLLREPHGIYGSRSGGCIRDSDRRYRQLIPERLEGSGRLGRRLESNLPFKSFDERRKECSSFLSSSETSHSNQVGSNRLFVELVLGQKPPHQRRGKWVLVYTALPEAAQRHGPPLTMQTVAFDLQPLTELAGLFLLHAGQKWSFVS